MASALRHAGWLRSISRCAAVLSMLLAGVAGLAQPAAAAGFALTPSSLPDGYVGGYYAQTITASGGTGATTLVVSAVTPVAGLTIDGSGTDTVSVYGPATAAGTATFHVHATDSAENSADQDYSVKIDLGLGPAQLPNAVVDVAYPGASITAAGGTAPYTFAVSAGALPAGLALSSSGVLSGTATQTGQYGFDVTATDSAGAPHTGSIHYVVFVSQPSACDAVAVNLVQNCGFENGDETGWSRRYPAYSAAFVDGSGDAPASGAHYFSFGTPGPADDVILQTLAGYTPGAMYDVSFWVATDAPAVADQHFFAAVEDAAGGDVTLLDLDEPRQTPLHKYTATFQAGTAKAPTLVFGGRRDSGWADLDDVVVTRHVTPPPPYVAPAPTVHVTTSESPSTVGDPVTFTATISPTPSCGRVTWTVDGSPASTPGSGAGDTYTLGPVAALSVGTHQVAANYSGCLTMDAATGSVNQVVLEPPATPDEAGPTITARISSAQPMRHGWYRSPVHVAFRCTPGSAPLTTPCPDPVTRSKSAAEQTVTGSIEDSRGRRASVTVTLDIDRRAPVIEVGFDGGKLACQASDALSGVAWCRLRHHSGTRRGVTTTWWTAVAADVAGNTTTKHGRFAVS